MENPRRAPILSMMSGTKRRFPKALSLWWGGLEGQSPSNFCAYGAPPLQTTHAGTNGSLDRGIFDAKAGRADARRPPSEGQ